MTAPETIEKLDKLIADVNEIKTVLKGYNGYQGLCGSHDKLWNEFLTFRRMVLIVFSFAVGSGILGGTIWGLLK